MDLKKLISEVAANFEPEYDCVKLEDLHLLVIYCVYTIWGCQYIIRIFDTKGEAPFRRETRVKVAEISRNPGSDNLANLYAMNPDPRPLRFLVWLRLAQKNITQELEKRHRPLKAGWAFFQMERLKWQVELNEFHSAIDVEKLTSYRANKRTRRI